MTKLIGLTGLSLATLAIGIYFHLPEIRTLSTGLIKGMCFGIFVLGGGLFLDSLKK
jgi:hypothetical protein